MEITITIPDEIAVRAQARGLTAESYVEKLLHKEETLPKHSKSRVQRLADMERFIEEISRNSENIPQLPDEAFTRESFYSDHD